MAIAESKNGPFTAGRPALKHFRIYRFFYIIRIPNAFHVNVTKKVLGSCILKELSLVFFLMLV